jgi:hypothetical protein
VNIFSKMTDDNEMGEYEKQAVKRRASVAAQVAELEAEVKSAHDDL